MANFGDGLALGPDLVHAAESAVAQAVAPLDSTPDLVCVFVCSDDPVAIGRAAERATQAAGAAVTIGCSATGVIGGDRGVEEDSAVSAFAASLPGARLAPYRLETLRGDDHLVVAGMPEAQDDDVAGILLADPYSFPVDAFVDRSGEVLPGLPLVGGMASGPHGRESVRLFLDGEVFDSGAAGVVIGGPVVATTVVSQGCRPIGPAMTVTRAEDNLLLELAGTPALLKLEEIVGGLPETDRLLVENGLHIGIAMDEYADAYERGDFLIRGVIGADTDLGALAIGDVAEVGRTVRFQVRDADTADRDLIGLLEKFDLAPAEGALLFSCSGRGRSLFPSADHDPRTVRQMLGAGGVGGFFAAGEIGPVGGRNHVHGFTASILAFASQYQEGNDE